MKTGLSVQTKKNGLTVIVTTAKIRATLRNINGPRRKWPKAMQQPPRWRIRVIMRRMSSHHLLQKKRNLLHHLLQYWDGLTTRRIGSSIPIVQSHDRRQRQAARNDRVQKRPRSGDRQQLKVTNCPYSKITIVPQYGQNEIPLQGVFYVPGMKKNMLLGA